VNNNTIHGQYKNKNYCRHRQFCCQNEIGRWFENYITNTQTYLFNVCLCIEVSEEDNEGNHIDYQHVLHPQGEVAPGLYSIDAHDHCCCELDLQEIVQPVLFIHNCGSVCLYIQSNL
jgi:hypothetical protein